MTRESFLWRVKRQIRMGLYESDEKWQVAVARLAADVRPSMLGEPSTAHGPKRRRILTAALPVYN